MSTSNKCPQLCSKLLPHLKSILLRSAIDYDEMAEDIEGATNEYEAKAAAGKERDRLVPH